jgi:hypothetical protein
LKYTCMKNCMNPTVGFFRAGDIVIDPEVADVLKRDGQLQHFRKAVEDEPKAPAVKLPKEPKPPKEPKAPAAEDAVKAEEAEDITPDAEKS